MLYAVVQLSRGGLGPQDAAGLLGLPIGLAALLVSVFALRKPSESNTADLVRGWAATLAAQVASGEGRVYGLLLGDDTLPIDLAYTLQPAPGRNATAPPHGRLLPAPPPVSAVLPPPSSPAGGAPHVASYWRDTRPQRLVVTGAAGAGKTVFALALILALTRNRTDTDLVPVRIPVALWDTTTPLDAFLIQRLIQAYGWPHQQAAALVEHGMVLPVLDGLDEMDPILPDGTPDPDAPRARATLEKLDAYRVRGEPGPVVLTCRTSHLEALAARGFLRDSARVAIEPVALADAVNYLTTRAQDQTRWQRLIDQLTSRPTSALSTWLSTPWRLCLVATVYHHDGDPRELNDRTTAQDLDDHLLARFIPAASRLHSHSRRRSSRQPMYHPDQVHRWLRHLTGALAPTATPDAGTPVPARAGTDLVLHELWPLAGRARVRVVDTALSTITVLLPVPLAWATPDPAPVLCVFGVLAVCTGRIAAMNPSPPRRLGFTRPAAPPRVLSGLMLGVMCALLLAPAVRLPYRLELLLMTGFMVGLGALATILLLSALAAPPSREARPWQLLKDDLAAGLVLGLTFGTLTGLSSVLTTGLLKVMAPGRMAGEDATPPDMLMGGLAVALAVSLMGSQLLTATRRYLIFVLCSRTQLPFRLVVFLDWACEAGLLRHAGPAYQFRHRELQQWLTNHPEPATTHGP
ncbi:NACHT domain-containing protein [Streptomyces sp. NPDC059718]